MAHTTQKRAGVDITMYNITCTVANTEYSQVLPAGTTAIHLRSRVATEVIRFAFETGKVDTPTEPYYSVVGANNNRPSFFMNGLLFYGKTLYVGSGSAGAVAEIIVITTSTS